MERKIYERLKAWKEEDKGRSCVLIQGARRVGKSYVAEAFAKKESFVISINEVGIPLYTFTCHFMGLLRDNCDVRYSWGESIEDLRKAYKKASMPPRAKKERPEDAVVYSDLDQLTPQELFRGIIKTYAEV